MYLIRFKYLTLNVVKLVAFGAVGGKPDMI